MRIEANPLLVSVIDVNTRDISHQFLDQHGSMRTADAKEYAQTTPEERALFGNRHAIYGFITTELVEYVSSTIGGRTAIEIGSGHGALAAALGITATDSHQQQDPTIAAYYQQLGQPVITYGKNVENLDALKAIKKHQPQVVVGCWVTHKYDPARHAAGGNQDGVNEESVIANCETYIFIGNEKVHANKSILRLPHRKITPPWLYSRAANGSPNFIAIWENSKPKQHSLNQHPPQKEA